MAAQTKNLTTPRSLWTTRKHRVSVTRERVDSYHAREVYRLRQTVRAELLGVITLPGHRRFLGAKAGG